MRAVAGQLAKRGKTNGPAVGRDPRAVHAGAAHDCHPPLPIGAGAQDGEGVVAHDRPPRPLMAGKLGDDPAVVQRQVRARQAEDTNRGRGAFRDSLDRAGQTIKGSVGAEAEVVAASAPDRSVDSTFHVDQGDIGLRRPAVHRQHRLNRKLP